MSGGRYDLAIVITREEFHSFSATTNPYLVTKAALMSQGVPVQEIQIETMESTGRQYILNNVALACYGKLGGIPYTILASRQVAHELIIGLDSLQLGEGRLSARSRVRRNHDDIQRGRELPSFKRCERGAVRGLYRGTEGVSGYLHRGD